MTKYILVGGYIHKAPDGGKAFCEEIVRGISHSPIRILDCLFARPKDSQEKRFQDDREFFLKNTSDFTLDLALPETFKEQIKNSDVIIFQGARPEDLMKVLENIQGWKEELAGKVVVGSSGGASTLAQYFGVGKSTTGSPRLGEGLGLLSIKFIPHWESDYGEGFSADWGGLLEKLKAYREDIDVITLRDEQFSIIEKE
ncbi:MAG: Type 1 glutamine amidotransferase-like domain-containing protein [Candidatus Pacebacteria bacterium]|nr:Type 1 glutamine amidotransferase-like domain-containing protein [Candidatus Paceibacterota bacterium]